ncbi:MAG: recombinase RecA [candidate division WOR-3 bacterium]
MKDDRKKALEMAIKQIEKVHGKGAIMRLGERELIKVPVISTGSISLDLALGIGGYPRGRIIEIFGPEASGKTTLALHAIAEVQKEGGIAAFIDAEHALDPVYAEKLGVNLSELWISQPDTGEQALEIAETLVRSGAVDLIVVDSVAALVPKAEITGEMGEAHVGLQARLMSQAMRKLAGVLNKSKTCAIFINQIRHRIGVLYGNPETTPGGLALKFHASLRLEIKKVETIKSDEEVIGNRVKVKVVKNKLAPPFKEATFDILYGKGISKESELIDLAVEKGIIQKSGAWYAYKGRQLGQGKDNVRKILEEDKKLFEEIEKELKKELFEKDIKEEKKD